MSKHDPNLRHVGGKESDSTGQVATPCIVDCNSPCIHILHSSHDADQYQCAVTLSHADRSQWVLVVPGSRVALRANNNCLIPGTACDFALNASVAQFVDAKTGFACVTKSLMWASLWSYWLGLRASCLGCCYGYQVVAEPNHGLTMGYPLRFVEFFACSLNAAIVLWGDV